MKNEKFTPAPWVIDFEISEDGPMLAGPNNLAHVQVYGKPARAKANAHLIAAAPDLFAALERIITINGSTDSAEAMVKEFKFIAQQAIAKARGES